jgi:hypothetical protein
LGHPYEFLGDSVRGVKELPASLSRLVIYLYCAASVFFIGFMGKVAEGIFDLRGQMHKAGLSWYVVVYEPQFILPSIFIAGAVIMSSLVIGAVWFFASQRRGDISR